MCDNWVVWCLLCVCLWYLSMWFKNIWKINISVINDSKYFKQISANIFPLLKESGNLIIGELGTKIVETEVVVTETGTIVYYHSFE